MRLAFSFRHKIQRPPSSQGPPPLTEQFSLDPPPGSPLAKYNMPHNLYRASFQTGPPLLPGDLYGLATALISSRSPLDLTRHANRFPGMEKNGRRNQFNSCQDRGKLSSLLYFDSGHFQASKDAISFWIPVFRHCCL